MKIHRYMGVNIYRAGLNSSGIGRYANAGNGLTLKADTYEHRDLKGIYFPL